MPFLLFLSYYFRPTVSLQSLMWIYFLVRGLKPCNDGDYIWRIRFSVFVTLTSRAEYDKYEPFQNNVI